MTADRITSTRRREETEGVERSTNLKHSENRKVHTSSLKTETFQETLNPLFFITNADNPNNLFFIDHTPVSAEAILQ
jgi:hypothetical protein